MCASVHLSAWDIMLRRALNEFLKHSKESRGGSRARESSRESKQGRKQASKNASKQANKQAGSRQGNKQAGRQARKQSNEQALKKHSVRAMPCRGLFLKRELKRILLLQSEVLKKKIQTALRRKLTWHLPAL